MKICVLIKQVPDKDSVITLSDGKINTDGLTYATNESDSYALEEALLLKEKHGGEVIACSLGPETSLQVIKDALAKGADRGLFISNEGLEESDILATAKSLSEALKSENFDLIFSGLQSDDEGNAQLGLLIAELLNTSHASLVMGTEVISESVIRVKQELEGGWYRWTELDFPASITVQSGLNKPRYASLRGIMMMKKKPIDRFSASELSKDTVRSKTSVLKMYIPQKTKETTYIEGSPDDIAAQLLDKLTNDIKVL